MLQSDDLLCNFQRNKEYQKTGCCWRCKIYGALDCYRPDISPSNQIFRLFLFEAIYSCFAIDVVAINIVVGHFDFIILFYYYIFILYIMICCLSKKTSACKVPPPNFFGYAELKCAVVNFVWFKLFD